ncbi:MAG: DoxX family protein [Arenimonas sp.]
MNGLVARAIALFERIPHSVVALLARIGIGATFWLSGQTKIEGLVLDPIGLHAEFGWPHVSEGALELFRSEYALPLLSPEFAAPLAAFSEHLFPLLLVLGLGSRFAALALLGMTAVIEVFVYPDAWPTHGVWAACLLLVIARGPGVVSIDHLLARRRR